MSHQIFSNLRAARVPESLKERVLSRCQAISSEPYESATNTSWLDSLLQASATVAVLLFTVTCLSLFVSDQIAIPFTRFSRLDSRSEKGIVTNKEASWIVIRRGTSWL